MATAKLLHLGMPYMANNGVSLSNIAVDLSTASALEYYFLMSEPATITSVGMRLANISGTSPTYRVSLQGWADGIPDGTIKGGGSPASATFNPSSLGWSNSSWHAVTLDNAYAASRGELICVVIEYFSGTVDTGNKATFTLNSGATLTYNTPFSAQFKASVPSRSKTGGGVPIIALYSAGSCYGFPMLAAYNPTVNSGTNPNEAGLAFSLPANFCSTYKVLGFYGIISCTGGHVARCQLYDGTTVLQTRDWDTDNMLSSGQKWMEILFTESSLSVLNAGTTYYLGIAPQDTTSSMGICGFTVNTASDLAAWPQGQDFRLATRNGGAWTETNTTRPLLGLILDDLTPPSGGAARNPGIRTGGGL